MKEQEISIRTARLAKKKGFYFGRTLCYQSANGFESYFGNYTSVSNTELKTAYLTGVLRDMFGKQVYLITSQTSLQKWLRDTHKLHIEVKFGKDKTTVWFEPEVYSLKNPKDGYSEQEFNESYANLIELDSFDTYEKALEFGLYNALKLIK